MRITYLNLFIFLFSLVISAQEDDIVQLKNVSDTILNSKRTLEVSDPFNAVKTMQKLFPGKLYKLSDDNTFISWKCKNCKPAPYKDANEIEGDQLFPYQDGVATRVLENINYVDSKGNQFKLLLFNHSNYDTDGAQTGRFSGGLIGITKFAKNGTIWQMRSFQPAIAAFGSFSRAPSPKLVQIGEDQYAFALVQANGGAGAPYSGYLYLIAGFGGKYQPIMELGYYSLINNGPINTEWSSTYAVVNDGKKKFFRDFIIITKGFYQKTKGNDDDYEVDLPLEIRELAKTKKQFNFTIEKRLSFNGKWYIIVGKPVVKFSNIKLLHPAD